MATAMLALMYTPALGAELDDYMPVGGVTTPLLTHEDFCKIEQVLNDCGRAAEALQGTLLLAHYLPSEVLLTVVEDGGKSRLVVTARLTDGDYILTPYDRKVVKWYNTSYKFDRRESVVDHNTWMSIRQPPNLVTVGSK